MITLIPRPKTSQISFGSTHGDNRVSHEVAIAKMSQTIIPAGSTLFVTGGSWATDPFRVGRAAILILHNKHVHLGAVQQFVALYNGCIVQRPLNKGTSSPCTLRPTHISMGIGIYYAL